MHSTTFIYRPLEKSSKIPIPPRKLIIKNDHVHKPRDPRFEEGCGILQPDLFKKSYHWIRDIKERELNQAKHELKKEKNSERKQAIKDWIISEESKRKTDQDKEKMKEILRERKKLEYELTSHGKKPFYLKNSDKKKLFLMEKYKEHGNVSDHKLEKRRQHQSAKQHKNVPLRRE